MAWEKIQSIDKTAAATSIQLNSVDKLGKYAFKKGTLVEKGQLINMTLGNRAVAGTNNQYRVLKNISGDIWEVLAIYDYGSSCQYNSSGINTYSGAELDTALNTTFYNELTAEAKNAIVQKNITSYGYNFSNSVYNTTTHVSYADYSTKTTHESIGNRYVYALDIEDIENYFSGTFSTADLWTLFWNATTIPSYGSAPWLRSCINKDPNSVWKVYNGNAYLGPDYITNYRSVQPAFCIDLSKIDWH